MLHGEVCTVLKESVQLLAFVFSIVFLDGFMQIVESCDQCPASKQVGDLCTAKEACLLACLPHLGGKGRQLSGRWFRIPAGWKPVTAKMDQLSLQPVAMIYRVGINDMFLSCNHLTSLSEEILPGGGVCLPCLSNAKSVDVLWWFGFLDRISFRQ